MIAVEIWTLFDTTEDRDTYVSHPLQVDYLRGIGEKVERLVIYDF